MEGSRGSVDEVEESLSCFGGGRCHFELHSKEREDGRLEKEGGREGRMGLSWSWPQRSEESDGICREENIQLEVVSFFLHLKESKL